MIVVFGSINLDLIFRLPALPKAGQTVLGPEMAIEPGGKGANQAVAAARDGARVLFAGAVGQDALATQALATMAGAGVDLTRVARADTATGCAAICVAPDGANQIAVASGANLRVHAGQVEPELLAPGTTVLMQAEVPLDGIAAVVDRARRAGARTVLNLAPAAPLPPETLRLLDVLVVNEDEGAALGARLGMGGDAAALPAALPAALHAALGADVVVTLGERGVAAATRAGAFHLPAHDIVPVDTTGAGDCFTGVLAAGLDRGLEMPAALRRANMAAALCCTRAGSQGTMPWAAETDAALTNS